MVNFKVPILVLTITTYELGEGNEWIATVTHTFFGDSEDELRGIVEAHKKTDAFFAASFTGNFNGITLQNSEPHISMAAQI